MNRLCPNGERDGMPEAEGLPPARESYLLPRPSEMMLPLLTSSRAIALEAEASDRWLELVELRDPE